MKYKNMGRLARTLVCLFVLFCARVLMCTRADAQITIGGSIYGGGNQGNTGGKTAVTVYAGNLHQVYGGARMADVVGSAFVHIDGKNAVDGSYIIIDKVYGGNDISGNIGTSATIPDSLTQAVQMVSTTSGTSLFARLMVPTTKSILVSSLVAAMENTTMRTMLRRVFTLS